MKTELTRAAVVAATRIIRDEESGKSVVEEVIEAYQSLYDADPDQSARKAKDRLREASELACDLVSFAQAVRGDSNAAA